MENQITSELYREYSKINPRNIIPMYSKIENSAEVEIDKIIQSSSAKQKLKKKNLRTAKENHILESLITKEDPLALKLFKLSNIDLEGLIECIDQGKRFNPTMRMLINAEYRRRVQFNKDKQFVLYNITVEGKLKSFLEKQMLVYNKSEEELVKILDAARLLDDRRFSLKDEDEYYYFRKYIKKLFGHNQFDEELSNKNRFQKAFGVEDPEKEWETDRIGNKVKKLIAEGSRTKEAIFEVAKNEGKNYNTVKTNYYDFLKKEKKSAKSLQTSPNQTK